MSPEIGPNSQFNKINARPNPFSKGTQKTQTYTRALGSTSIFAAGPGGWRGAARNLNPYDTQSMNVARFANMRASANVYAGRNIGSFGALAQQSAGGMNGMEKAMLYTQLFAMGAEAVKGLADAFGGIKTDKSDKTDKKGNVENPNGDNPGSGKIGKGGETSQTIAGKIETSKDTIKANVSDLEAINLADIASSSTVALSTVKEKYNIDVKVDVSNIATINIAGEIPTSDEVNAVKKQAELVKTNLSSANSGVQTIEVAGQRCASKLAAAEAELAGMQLDDPNYSTKQQEVQQLKQQQQDLADALSELKTIQGQLKEANGKLAGLAEKLPDLVETHNELIQDQKEKEADEKKDLKELAGDVKDLIGDITSAKSDGKVNRKAEKLKTMSTQISALKSLVAEHVNTEGQADAIAAADHALAQINSISNWSKAPEGAEAEADSTGVSADQLDKMNKEYGTNFEIDKETTIAGKKFQISSDGKFKVDGAEVKNTAFFAALDSAQSAEAAINNLKQQGIDLENYDPMQAINTINITIAANGENGTTVVDANGQSHSVKIENGNTNNATWLVDGQPKTREEFKAFIADKKLPS